MEFNSYVLASVARYRHTRLLVSARKRKDHRREGTGTEGCDWRAAHVEAQHHRPPERLDGAGAEVKFMKHMKNSSKNSRIFVKLPHDKVGRAETVK